MIEEAARTPSPSPLDEAPTTARVAGRRGLSLASWQERLLPYMMGSVLVFAAFFFVTSLIQLALVTNNIASGTDQEAANLQQALSPPAPLQPTADQALTTYRFQALARLDLYLLQRRYHEASVLLMAGVWVRYLGFVTGMILALLGAVFIVGKLREPLTMVRAEAGGIKGAFEGTSPGMLMVTAGTVLMLATIISQQQYSTTDTAVFVPYGMQGIALPTPALPSNSQPKPTMPSPDTPAATPTQGIGSGLNLGK